MRLCLIASAALLSTTLAARADTLLLTFITSGSGAFIPTTATSGAPFTNATLAFTTTVDSSQVRTAFVNGSSGPTYTYVRNVPLSINVSGVGSFLDSDDLTSFSLNGISNFSGVVPDLDLNAMFGNFDLELTSPVLAGLSLASALGPVTGTSASGTSVSEYFNTQAGRLTLTSEGAQSTFQVTDLSTPAAVTPEPSSLVLLASGLSGLALSLKRRVRTT